MAVADVTGDVLADLITVHTNSNVYVYPGRSNGSFGYGVANFNATFNNAFRDREGHWVVGAADVTGDGRAHLVSVSNNGNAYVWPGRSNGSLGGAVSSFNGTMALAVDDGQGSHVPVGVADVNGDGKADLVTHHTNGNVYVYRGSASGVFSGDAVSSFNGTMAMAQFDGSGHQVVGVMDVTCDDSHLLTIPSPPGTQPPYGWQSQLLLTIRLPI